MPHPYFDVPRPVVIGHRGAAGTHPENTIASFEAALAQGAQILESDVQVTRDGVPILLHDADLTRVTNGVGCSEDHDWLALGEIDAGYSAQLCPGDPDSPCGDPRFRDQGHRIPSLEQAFERFPNARFNLEIKCLDARAIETTLDLIDRFDRSDRTLLAAGEDDVMQALRRAVANHAAEPAMGASLGEIVAAIQSAVGNGAMPSGVMALQIPPEFAGQPLATPALIDHAHAHDVAVHVWTINDCAEIERLLALGVDGIVTDLPGQMSDWLAKNA